MPSWRVSWWERQVLATKRTTEAAQQVGQVETGENPNPDRRRGLVKLHELRIKGITLGSADKRGAHPDKRSSCKGPVVVGVSKRKPGWLVPKQQGVTKKLGNEAGTVINLSLSPREMESP